jgi:hypothetical protein
MTPSGIEPAAFRFVAQFLNHCATVVARWTERPSETWRGLSPPPKIKKFEKLLHLVGIVIEIFSFFILFSTFHGATDRYRASAFCCSGFVTLDNHISVFMIPADKKPR